MKLKPLVIACLTAPLLFGCSERSAGPEGDLDKPVASEPAKSAPARIELRSETLARVAELPQGELVKVDGGEVDEVEGAMHCSVDSVNGAAIADAAVQAGGAFRLSGWIQQAETVPGAVTIVLRGDEVYAFRGKLEAERPDIAEKLAVAKVSDITGEANLGGIAAGEYYAYIIRADGGGRAKCVSDSKLVIR